MWTRHRKPSKLRFLVIPILCCGALAYFVYHANNGTYGLKAKEGYEARVAELKQEVALLDAKVTVLEHRTSLLRDGTLEQDIIDEQARRMLGLTRPNEIVIYTR